MSDIELLPCPLCEVDEPRSGPTATGRHAISCRGCGLYLVRANAEDAAKAWNDRPGLTVPEVLRELRRWVISNRKVAAIAEGLFDKEQDEGHQEEAAGCRMQADILESFANWIEQSSESGGLAVTDPEETEG